MKRRDFLTALGATALVGKGLTAETTENPPAAARQAAPDYKGRPNIIFLMSDQQRWDALGVLNPHIKTPSLDRLARAGVTYRQATCQAPMCIPSRNSLMFSLYPSQLGIRSNGHGLGDKFLPFDPLPAQLQRAGYQTAGFGKTHWGGLDEVPSTRGFEVRVVGEKAPVLLEKGAQYQTIDDPQVRAALHRETASFGAGGEGVGGYIGCTSSVPARYHLDGWLAEQCLKYLDSALDPERPLFLYLSFYQPHPGFNVPKEFEDLYRIEDIPDTLQPPWGEERETHLAYCDRTNNFLGTRYRQWHEAWSHMSQMEKRRTTLRYYANCSWLDSYYGQVVDRLTAMGRLDNSLIVYASDHGEMLGERNFRFSKYCLFESSVRVPMILSGSVIPTGKRGTIDDRPAELVDLMPTMLQVAGAHAPTGIQGFDLLSDPKRLASFCEFHDAGAPAYMWRTEDWKLILFMDRPLAESSLHLNAVKGELYDLKHDPNEWNSLYQSNEHASLREQMKTELLMHVACAATAYPRPVG